MVPRSQQGKPRFLWVHLYDPHAPYEPPQAYKDRFPTTSTSARSPTRMPPSRRCSRACARIDPPPLVIVTGDHGEARGDHGELTHGLFCYEATLHVPLFAWCPGS